MNDRDRVVDHLVGRWLGPTGGENEVLHRTPTYAYLVGTLYPVEEHGSPTSSVFDEEELETTEPGGLVADDPDDDPDEESDGDDDAGDDLIGAFGWAPSSMGISFVRDAETVQVEITAGIYMQGESVEEDSTHDASWIRRPLAESVEIPAGGHGRIEVLSGRAILTWRDRRVGSHLLTTVSLSNSRTCAEGAAKRDPETCLFQVRLRCSIRVGCFHPYPQGDVVDTSMEELQLQLRYRARSVHAIGHGVSASWEDGPIVSKLWTETVPRQVVPAVRARVSSSEYLSLEVLADPGLDADDLVAGLQEIASGYKGWVSEQEQIASSVGSRYREAAQLLVQEQDRMLRRMEEGIALLRLNAVIRTAFRLANRAMADQMSRQSTMRDTPGLVGSPLPEIIRGEPRWHPFQLAFILASLASTVEGEHPDRDVVDLIWFPTGGGKTEAYLGLAAIEMIRRRLVRGPKGGGTAVITRYTMRLLTAQQFQRAATLICALERLRRSDQTLRGVAPFSIGLWLGNTTTPGLFSQAAEQFKSVLKDAIPGNPFQLRQCPWCGTQILPARRTRDQARYGVRASSVRFEFFCPHPECDFHDQLPVQVVDQAIYEEPPTMLVATVDKFARLAWSDKGSSLFGLGATPHDPPSLVIQDELHLISGPLGTIVGAYEAALRGLMRWAGSTPKVVASTATIRAAGNQIESLMAAPVAVFPPSGLNADDNYFSEPDPDKPGREYVGIMPQAHTPSWALAQMGSDMLQAPVSAELRGASRDAYWTLVVYHNSLRELGRTMTILRDDVRSNLERRRLAGEGVRPMARDGIEELNGNVSAEDLLRVLDRLSIGPDQADDPLDALATTNIMSVGIDVPRLGFMLVNGQPKTTSEYIQATSRVGRGKVPGLVVTMFRSGKPRDRSVFESFRGFHQSYYRQVEPASVTPWSLQARRRALRAAFVILVRHGAGLAMNEGAIDFDPMSAGVRRAADLLRDHIAVADKREYAAVAGEIEAAIDDWGFRAESARKARARLRYRARIPEERLLREFTDDGPGWPVMNSMRSVDRVVRVRADGERR